MKNFFTFLALIFTVFQLAASSTYATSLDSKEGDTKLSHSECSTMTSAKVDFFPWTTQALMMVTCPTSQVFNLASGECGVEVPSFGFGLPALNPGDIPFNQNTNTVTINSTRYCSSGQTRYARTFTNSVPTDMRIKIVNLGVYEAINSPSVKLNFYGNTGILLGSYTAVLPNINRAVHSIVFPSDVNIKIPALQPYTLEVVANAPYISRFKIGMNDQGNLIPYNDAIISSDKCSTNYNAEFFLGSSNVNQATIFNVVGTPDAYKLTNALNNYKEGDIFPIGVTPMLYNVTDANGVNQQCAFSITVNEFPNPTGALACNDLVQVSLDDECEFIVTPDMLLEGDQYGCFDKYTVQITSHSGVNLRNKVTRANIGQTLKTQVIAPNGNSCWGEILVQDKVGPILVCNDVYTNCSTDLKPGSVITSQIPVAATILEAESSVGTNLVSSRTYDINVGDFAGATILDLNVFIDVTHDDVSHLAANVTAPNGVTVPLFFNDNGSLCPGKNIMATFDDESTSALVCEAAVVPSIAGTYKPANSLSSFDGLQLKGTWRVTIYDLVSGVSGKVNNVHLIFEQSGTKIPFPTNHAINYTLIDDKTYLIEGIDGCSDATLSYVDEIVEEDCNSIYSKVIRRCWDGQDKLGNVADNCCQYIYVYRNSLSTLSFPANIDNLSCFDYGTTIPPVSVTGLPYGNFCDNVQIAAPTDVRIDICNKSYKLLRTHKVIEWCSGRVIVHNQIIKVVDNQGPKLNCPANITISTDDYACSATYVTPRPTIVAECSDILTYHLSYNSFNDVDSEYVALNANQSTNVISGLLVGDNNVKWTVTDQCGNSSECKFVVTVKDLVKPNAVCDRTTTTSITGNGKAIIEAFTFDDGSVDNCSVTKYEVRKITDLCKALTSEFTPSVEFCCSEVNTTVMVELRVTDVYGNSNSCMVEVLVQDKLPPYITACPKDITLDCQADYTDFSVTGNPEYVDNCSVINVKHQDNVQINNCGVGTVTRTWTVEDKQGYKNSCVQVITLIDSKPFLASDIIWPSNYETKKCYSILDPESLPQGYSKPSFADDNCSLVAAHYKDQVFKFVDGACEKVLRTWTVIDWCTYNDQNPVLGQGWYEHIQIIKLQNDVAPDFEFACIDRAVPVYGNCEGDINFSMTAIDDCPEDNTNLNWKYELYTESGTVPLAVVNSDRFSRKLAIGKYIVKWTAEDKCGNRAFCTHKLNIIEGKKPSPYCLSSLTTAVMNSNGTISIWAKDYDRGSSDNCTPTDQLKFTFFGATPVDSLLSVQHYFKGQGQLATLAEYNAGLAQVWLPATKSSGMLFDCKDIPNGISQEVSLDMTVTDLAGNQDYCTITLVLQDNVDFCPNSNSVDVAIQGGVGADGFGLKGATVYLESDKTELNRVVTTDTYGKFSINSLPKGNKYTIKVSDNSNVLNGVSTLDLVMIQRHILGLALLDDPKKIIAADVDNNSKITASDLVALRKTILGIANTFPNGQESWRFVTASHVFNGTTPFPFTEHYDFLNLSGNKVGQNFHAVKIGDVNSSATFNANNVSTESRNSRKLELMTELLDANIGETIEVPVYAGQFSDVFGYQFTMEFDEQLFTFDEIIGGELTLTQANFGLQSAGQGMITTSWNSDVPVTMTEGSHLFSVKLIAKKAVTASQLVTISSNITPALSFDAGYKSYGVTLKPRTSELENGFALHQNKPNPFNGATNISFSLPEADVATITITDVTGKILKVISGNYQKGENMIMFNASEENVTGILFYRIDSGNFTDTKRMIVIE